MQRIESARIAWKPAVVRLVRPSLSRALLRATGILVAVPLAFRAAAILGGSSSQSAALEQAARLDPANPLPHLALARLHASRKALDLALQAADKALALQPGLVDGMLLRGDLLDDQGQAAQAIASYRQAAQAVPTLAAPHLRIGMIAQRTGQVDLAVASYRKAIELDPRQAVAYNNLATLALERKQDLGAAEGWARKAVEIGPDVADFHDTLGWVLRARGQGTQALSALRQAARLAPKNPEILYHLAVVYAEAGDKGNAKAALTRALRTPGSFPSSAAAKKLLASVER